MNKKGIIITILTSLITALLVGSISAYATSYLYNSSEVSYDNKASNITSDNVQGAIDELYTQATNYNDLNTRVTNLEESKKWTIFVNQNMSKGQAVSLPSSYNELKIYVAYNAGDTIDTYYPFSVVWGFQNHQWILGYGTGTANYAQIATTDNKLTLVDCRLNGNVLSSVKVVGLYR